MNSDLPKYSVAIRTLGSAGEKYQILLNSLANQTHKASKIFVYLAKGYDLPKETIGVEEIVYVPKGMVRQRALEYKEIETEWILFLDDDIYIRPDGVERMFKNTIEQGADVCAADVFPHYLIPWHQRLAQTILLTSIPRLGRSSSGYRVNFLGTDCYNPNPKRDVAWSTTNAGCAFM